MNDNLNPPGEAPVATGANPPVNTTEIRDTKPTSDDRNPAHEGPVVGVNVVTGKPTAGTSGANDPPEGYERPKV